MRNDASANIAVKGQWHFRRAMTCAVRRAGEGTVTRELYRQLDGSIWASCLCQGQA
jgi:hypothetical protein